MNRATLPAPYDTRLTLPPGAIVRDCGDLRTTDNLIADSQRARTRLEDAIRASRAARGVDPDDDSDAVAVIR